MKIKQTVLLFALLLGFGSFLSGPVATAATCAGVDTAIISCSSSGSDLGTCSDGSYPNNGQCNLGKCADSTMPLNGKCYKPDRTTESGSKYTPPIPTAGECVVNKDNKPLKNAGPIKYVNNKPTCPTGEYIEPATYKKASSIERTGIWLLLVIAINLLTYGIGLAGVAGIVWGAMLYTTASGKPEQIKKANMVIANTVLGMIVYAAAYAFMNYMIPGGLIG